MASDSKADPEINLETLANDMYAQIQIKTREYQGKQYEKVFLGEPFQITHDFFGGQICEVLRL